MSEKKLSWDTWSKTGNLDKAALLLELQILLSDPEIQVSQIKMRIGVPVKVDLEAQAKQVWRTEMNNDKPEIPERGCTAYNTPFPKTCVMVDGDKDTNPVHPGEILQEEFLDGYGISQSDFAKHIGVSFQRINEIVNRKRGITPETAWLFSLAFGTTAEYWMNLQVNYDLATHRPRHSKFNALNSAKR